MHIIKLQELLDETFNQRDFWLGAIYKQDKNGPKIRELLIQAYWCVRIKPHEFSQYIFMTVAKTDKWRKGFLVVPPKEDPRSKDSLGIGLLDYARQETLKLLDLTDWDDPVAQALQNIDLYREREQEYGWYVSSRTCTYHLLVRTLDSEASLMHDGLTDDPKLIDLINALLTSIYEMAERYDDDVLRERIRAPFPIWEKAVRATRNINISKEDSPPESLW